MRQNLTTIRSKCGYYGTMVRSVHFSFNPFSSFRPRPNPHSNGLIERTLEKLPRHLTRHWYVANNGIEKLPTNSCIFPLGLSCSNNQAHPMQQHLYHSRTLKIPSGFTREASFPQPHPQWTSLLCVCVLSGSFRGMGAFYFKIESRTDVRNTIMTRTTAHKQLLTMGV